MTSIKRCVQAFFNDAGSLFCLNCDKNDAVNYKEFHRDLDVFDKFICRKCFQYVGVSIVKSVDCQYCLKESELVSYLSNKNHTYAHFKHYF